MVISIWHARWRVLLLAPAVACQPVFDERGSAVGDLRILAVQSEPAEAPPGAIVHYRALVGDPSGTRAEVPIDWAYCTQPKPIGELNDVGAGCLAWRGDPISPFGAPGVSASGAVPSAAGENACNQFGPDLPDTKGRAPGRPADPDGTGGYYQPVRLLVDRGGGRFDAAVAETRITCNLPGATSEVQVDYRKKYRRNQNPVIDRVRARRESGEEQELVAEDADSELVVPRGATIALFVEWPACPARPSCGDAICGAGEDADACPEDCADPKGCAGAEAYVSFDLVSRALLDRREAMRVSWYATGGSFADDRTGRGEDEVAFTSTENRWTAPRVAGEVTLWVVLRDSRGGLTWKAYRVVVD